MSNKFGYKKISNFLTSDIISTINSEVSVILKKPTINFSNGYIRIHPQTKAIPFPFIYIRSTNLVEMAIDVYDKIIESGLSNDSFNLSLADVQIMCDTNKNQLPWHTDHSEGGVLALIYLKGGGERSGGAIYMEGTHLISHDPDKHHISREEISNNKNEIKSLTGNAGDMILYNINGFHSRLPCYEERWAIRFTYLPKNIKKGWDADDIYIPTSALTEKVMLNLPKMLKPHDKILPFLEMQSGFSYALQNPLFLGTKLTVKYFIYEYVRLSTRILFVVFRSVRKKITQIFGTIP